MFLFYHWPFLHVYILQENILVFTLIFGDYVVFYGTTLTPWSTKYQNGVLSAICDLPTDVIQALIACASVLSLRLSSWFSTKIPVEFRTVRNCNQLGCSCVLLGILQVFWCDYTLSIFMSVNKIVLISVDEYYRQPFRMAECMAVRSPAMEHDDFWA